MRWLKPKTIEHGFYETFILKLERGIQEGNWGLVEDSLSEIHRKVKSESQARPRVTSEYSQESILSLLASIKSNIQRENLNNSKREPSKMRDDQTTTTIESHKSTYSSLQEFPTFQAISELRSEFSENISLGNESALYLTFGKSGLECLGALE